MSIIHDALKKAQGPDRPEPTKDRPLANLQVVDYDNRRSRINWGPLFVLAVILLIAAPIIAPIFSSPFGHQSAVRADNQPRREVLLGGVPAAPAPAAAAAPTQRRQFGIEEAPRAAAFGGGQMPRIQLSGVAYSAEGNSYVILNKRVMRVGDQINSIKLVSVAPESATFEINGQLVTLPA